jgi:hypothetical protein
MNSFTPPHQSQGFASLRTNSVAGAPSPTVWWRALGEVGTAQKRGMLCQEPHISNHSGGYGSFHRRLAQRQTNRSSPSWAFLPELGRAFGLGRFSPHHCKRSVFPACSVRRVVGGVTE